MSESTILVGSGRRTGKTSALIQMAAAFGVPIVTPHKEMASSVMRLATEQCRERLVEVVSFEELVKRPEAATPGPVIIDDADIILGHLLGRHVAAMTVDAARPVKVGDL